MTRLLPEPLAPWAIPAFSAKRPSSDSEWILSVLREPEIPVRRELEIRGFRFLSAAEQVSRSETLEAAAALIGHVTSLATAVRAHVEGLSLIDADEAYDISHSEPRWPKQIFVSCPTASGEVSALRFAESVVHEAMHLQLSRLEGLTPLIEDQTTLMHSPWKSEPRLLNGILHGIYVFVCISAFLRELLRLQVIQPATSSHIRQRLREISDEVLEIPVDRLQQGLTMTGRSLLQRLLPS